MDMYHRCILCRIFSYVAHENWRICPARPLMLKFDRPSLPDLHSIASAPLLWVHHRLLHLHPYDVRWYHGFLLELEGEEGIPSPRDASPLDDDDDTTEFYCR